MLLSFSLFHLGESIAFSICWDSQRSPPRKDADLEGEEEEEGEGKEKFLPFLIK